MTVLNVLAHQSHVQIELLRSVVLSRYSQTLRHAYHLHATTANLDLAMAENTDAPVWIDCDAGADDALGDVNCTCHSTPLMG